MQSSLEQVTKEAMGLSAHDKFILVECLLESAEAATDPEAEAAWDTEIHERIQAIDEGRVVGVSYAEVMRVAERATDSVNVRFVEEARNEFLDVIRYYEEARCGLGRRFKDEVDRCVRRIAGSPDGYQVRTDTYRRINLRGFPYYLPYIVRKQTLWVLAVAHARRRPLYWISRRIII